MAFNSRTVNSSTPKSSVEREKRATPGMTDVSKTLFLPLFFRAQETREDGIIRDQAAVDIVDRLQYDNQNFRVDREMQLIISLRTAILDRITRQYIDETIKMGRQPVVINLGAGLDTREYRFPEATWYQVDLAAPITLRQQYVQGSKATNIAASIFEEGWSSQIAHRDHVLVLVEGVLMYFGAEMVRKFFEILSRDFTHVTIAFDALAKRYSKLHAHQSIDVDKAAFKCGVSCGTDVEKMNPGFKTVEEFGYYQEYLSHSEMLQKRYRLIRFDATHKIYLMYKK
ncbi:MAG: class I SAM-dependent methyltransferase [Bacteroidales bacterium]|nr:class I SAM-dependent methyltransferase [Bacteroidales bacterium]